jgi:hypothetical protein
VPGGNVFGGGGGEILVGGAKGRRKCESEGCGKAAHILKSTPPLINMFSFYRDALRESGAHSIHILTNGLNKKIGPLRRGVSLAHVPLPAAQKTQRCAL